MDIDPFQVAVNYFEPENLDIICMVYIKQTDSVPIMTISKVHKRNFESVDVTAKETVKASDVDKITTRLASLRVYVVGVK